MTNLDRHPYRADGGDIGISRIREIADNPYGDEEKCWLAKRVLALLAELKFEHEQNVMASSALITQHVRANEAEARIAEYQGLISSLVGVSSSILREVERINKAAAAVKGEA